MNPTPRNNRFRTRWAPVLAGLVIFLGIALWVTKAFHDKISPGSVFQAPRTLTESERAARIEMEEISLVAEAVGTIRAKHETVLAGKILAQVEKVHVRAGDSVRRGDVLIELDAREWEARKAAAEAALQQARADWDLRIREHDRLEKLFERGAVSEHDFDMAVMRRTAAEARVRQAEKEIGVVDSTLVFTRIQATHSAVVVERLVEPGDMAVPGEPLLVLYAPDELHLETVVRESLLPFIQLEQALSIRVDAIDRRYQGIVREIVPKASEHARAFTVKVSLPETADLYPGMFGRLRIPYDTTTRLLVPEQAIRRMGQVQWVDLVDEDGTVVRREIKTGKRIDHRVEILSGLAPAPPGQPLPQVILP